MVAGDRRVALVGAEVGVFVAQYRHFVVTPLHSAWPPRGGAASAALATL